MSNCWNSRVAKRKKSWVLSVFFLSSTGSFISKIKIVVFGAYCLVAFFTVFSYYRKMKLVKFVG